MNGNHPPMTPVRTTSVLTSRNPSSIEKRIASLSSTLNNSLNNILNYSPPQYLDKNNVTKSSTSIASNNLNAIQSMPTNGNESKPTAVATTTNGHSSSNTATNKMYGTSLLCYQNVSPPSPTSSIVQENGNNAESSTEKTTDEHKSAKDSKSSSAITLSALIPGDTTTLPVAVKKRSKLRHRFSDVGSWGLRKKDRAHKYRSMNIESVELLGDPVIEDIFFVSNFFFELLLIGKI